MGMNIFVGQRLSFRDNPRAGQCIQFRLVSLWSVFLPVFKHPIHGTSDYPSELVDFSSFNLINGKCCVASFLKPGVAHLAVERLRGGVCFHSLVAASPIVPRLSLGTLGLQPIVKTNQKQHYPRTHFMEVD